MTHQDSYRRMTSGLPALSWGLLKGDFVQVQATTTATSVGSTSGSTVPNLANYIEYRRFLLDYYEFKKKTESTVLRPYTYSQFAAAADIKSPNYLKLVIEGQRNLSPEMAGKFARAMRLSKQQIDEFVLLVKYGQERDPQKRAQALRQLAELRFKYQVMSGEVSTKTLEILPNWLTWILYHMADQKNVSFEPDVLREMIRTETNPEQVRRALDKLFEVGLLAKNADDGRVCKARELMDDPQAIPPALVKKLQSELIYLGMESLFVDSPTDREFGAMTVALTEEEFNRLKFELRQLRKKWAKDISANRTSSKGDRVYQMNIQLFAITK